MDKSDIMVYIRCYNKESSISDQAYKESQAFAKVKSSLETRIPPWRSISS